MSNTKYPKRASLECFAAEIFKLVAGATTSEQQWAKWLQVPLEHAAHTGNIDLFNALIGAGADGSTGWEGCPGGTMLEKAARTCGGGVLLACCRYSA